MWPRVQLSTHGNPHHVTGAQRIDQCVTSIIAINSGEVCSPRACLGTASGPHLNSCRRRVVTLLPAEPARLIGAWSQTHFHWPAKKIGLLPALFFDEGKEWGRSRRLICPHLVGNNVADMIPALAKVRGDTLMPT